MIYKKLKEYVPEKLYCAYIGIALSIISSLCITVAYWYLYQFLSDVLIIHEFNTAIDSAIKIVLFSVLYAVIYFVGVWVTHVLAFRFETNLKKRGIENLMEASFSFYDKTESGKIRKIIDDNTALTHVSVAHLIPDLSAAIFVPIFGLIMAFIIDFRLGILFVLTIIIGGLIGKGMMGEAEFMGKYMQAQERMNSGAVEYVRGIGVLKIFKANIKSLKEFYDSVVEYSDMAFAYSMSCRVPYVSFQTFFNIFFVVLIPAFFYFTGQGEDAFELLTKSVFYVCFCGLIFAAFMKIMYVSMYQFQATSSVQKIEDLFAKMQEKKLQYGNINSMDKFDVEFKNVSFGYEDKMVIEDLSLFLESGKTYALVGSSGSGKSTIAKLMSGFYPVNSGEIKIGDHLINEYSMDALVSNIANVFQNSKLFKMSIFDNVKMAKRDATYEEVMEALHLAQCDEILDKFKERENAIIGSKGIYLSGGETQRVAIARAILKDANIVILDEASAAADPENEYELQKAFSNLMKNKTVIMIAHRLSSIKNVDEILVVKDGKVIERGKYADLMQKDTAYRSFQEQFDKANGWKVSK